ncbi:MAG: DUF4870 domain-containing protein [Rubrobacteridae bacterium]|nr:DUF4870 domain-containing protein [Rubrobacteridae bacterium]
MVEEQNGVGQSGPSEPEQGQPAPQQTTPTYSQEAGNQDNKTSTGLDPNLAGLLCYLFTWLTGLIFYLIEKDNKFVRFHALQSLLMSGAMFVIYIALMIISAILSHVPFIGPLVSLLAWLVLMVGGFALWIILMVKAYQGEKFKLPFIGDIAEKNA